MKTYSGSLFNFFLKIILPSFMALVLFILTLFFIVIPEFEQAMMDRKREMIQELTNSASSILEKYFKDETEGLISREEAQNTAISRIQYLRYGDENKDYFWITDMNPTMIMHPYIPELNGSDLTDYEDSHGKKMFIEFVEVVNREGHGFVEYMWQWKDDSTHVVPKLSYVKGFEPWGWIIGTGIYIEDVRREISALTSRLTVISIIISAITLLLLTFISLQSFRIERKRLRAESNLKESREKYRSLVEASTEGLVMISDNQIIFANAVFQELIGLNYEEITQRTWQSIFQLPQETSDQLEQGDYDIETVPFESTIKLSEDKEAEVLITITPILFYGRKAVIFSLKDISSDILMKRQLLESRERFKTLMDKLQAGIFRTTLDARGRFVEANDTALKLLGFEDNSQLQKTYILDLFAEAEDKKNFRKNLLEKGFIKNQIIALLKSNGTIAHMMVSLAVINNEEGQAVFCDGIIEPVNIKTHESSFHTKSVNIDEFRTILQNINILNLSEPYQTTGTDTTAEEVAKLVDENDSRCIVIVDEQKRLLGYITDKELTSGFGNATDSGVQKAYQIMKSPVPVIESNSTLFHARRVLKKTGASIVLISEKTGEVKAMISSGKLQNFDDIRICELLEDFNKAISIESLKNLRYEYIVLISRIVQSNIHSGIILQLLSDAFDAINTRLFELAFRQLGQPPSEFAFIVLGSEGRREQTLSTDQDNAIIYSDTPENPEGTAEYFLNLGKWISNALNVIGYSLCKGENMAMNPKWNQPLSVWKKYFNSWINTGHAKDLLDINIFFDFRLCYGSQQIVDELQQSISAASKSNPAYLSHLARNTFQKLSLSDPYNIKDSTSVVVNFARIYALQQGISQKNTLQRLKKLGNLNIVKESSNAETEKIMEFLTMLRLKHQAALILQGRQADNIIHVKQLTDFEQDAFKKALSGINTILSKLNFDFRLNI